MKKINYGILILVLFFALISSCAEKGHKQKKDKTVTTHRNQQATFQMKIATTDDKKEYTIGDIISFRIEQKDTLILDSAVLVVNNEMVETIDKFPYTFRWGSKDAKTGKNILEVRAFGKNTSSISKYTYTMLSDIVPKQYGYKVIKIYPHDRGAYTQGLVYENGFMYEATGLRGASTLRKVQFETGEVIQAYTLPKNIFGEGIAIVGDRIIQLSYQSYKGFVYDKNTFNLIMKFNYPKAVEGWGLAYDGTNLIMSDGTYNLHFLDPVSFTETGKLEVYDNEGPVKKLNELEIIEGVLWANIYLTFKIVQIDLKTGKVLAYIDLTDILPQRDYEKDTDVLNGIAYDREKKRIFVTGKKWPKLFEIELLEK